MAMAVIQGGSGFHYFAPCIYHYLCGAEVSFISVSADDIPDYEVSSVVQKVIICFCFPNFTLCQPRHLSQFVDSEC